jgi:hypothetical protein
LGRPSPKSPALYPTQIRALWLAALDTWPHETHFMVAVFARFKAGQEDEGGSPTLAALLEAYGHRVHPVPGRRFYGWRSVTVSRHQLEAYPERIAPGILNWYEGSRPIRAASVRPTQP